MSNLLALDQASVTSGYAIFEENELKNHGKFSFDMSDIGERLVKIREKVAELIKEYNIDEVVFEDIQYQANKINNVQTFKVLAEVYGIIQEYLTENKIPYSVVLASSWKSTLGIKGKDRSAQKKNAQIWVLDNCSIKATQDECDAICIGFHHLKKLDQDLNWE